MGSLHRNFGAFYYCYSNHHADLMYQGEII